MFYAHPDALVALDAPAAGPADFVVSGDFAATEWKIEPSSTDAVLWMQDRYGDAIAWITIRKSALPAFAETVGRLGLTV